MIRDRAQGSSECLPRGADPALGFEIAGAKSLSTRHNESGSYEEMIESYELLCAQARKANSPRLVP